MMFFFNKVQSSSSPKSFKVVFLLEHARMLERALVHGEDAPDKIAIALQEFASMLNKENPRGHAIYIDHYNDSAHGYGCISALPATDSTNPKPYFRIYYHKVARTATIPEAVAMTKGGAK